MNRNHSKSRELVRRQKATTPTLRDKHANSRWNAISQVMCSQFDWEGGP